MNNLFTKLLLVAALLLPTSATAYDFMVDSLAYVKNSDGITVTVTYEHPAVGNPDDLDSFGMGFETAYTSGAYDALPQHLVIPSIVQFGGKQYIVTSIGENAFEACGFKEITIPNTIVSIGSCAFRGCSFKNLIIPSSVNFIDKYAFIGKCGSLESIVVENGNTKYDSRNNCNALIETESNTIIVGSKLSFIPNTITHIGDYAFYRYTGLTSVSIPNSVTSIGAGAFYKCTGLASVSIPNSVTSIGAAAFYKCTGLTSMTIPNLVTSIMEGTFQGCSGLTSVTIPNSVTSIGDDVFNGCSSLTSIAIPNSVNTIGGRAFEGCSGLSSITLPNSITSIGGSAFWGSSGLRSIYSKIIEPQNVSYGNYIFQGVNTNHCKLYVPKGTLESYQFTAPWSNFLNIVEEEGGTTPLKGDMNDDGMIDVDDVNALINIILKLAK